MGLYAKEETNSSMKTQSLLQKAKAIHNRRSLRAITDEQIELAVAWARDEISYMQVHQVIGKRDGMAAYTLLARALREHIKRQTLTKSRCAIAHTKNQVNH